MDAFQDDRRAHKSRKHRCLTIVAVEERGEAEGLKVLVPALQLRIVLVRARRRVLIRALVVRLTSHSIGLSEVRREVRHRLLWKPLNGFL